MTKRYIYLRPLLLKIIAAVMLFCNFDPVAAEQFNLPGGFRLGSSLYEAKRNAASRGWQFVAISPKLPSSWLVKDQNISVQFCDNTVASVTQSSQGDLDDFAQFVFDLQMKRGKPKLQVVSFMAGSARISSIDARFAEVDGVGVAVQFSSTAGRLAISTNYFSDKCAEHARGR